MTNAIIIDDEKNGAEALQLLLEQNCPSINIIAIKHDAEEGIEAINTLKPHLVFLDIEMPTATGFDVLEATKGHQYEVIFTTAYQHYAIKALKAHAADYLLKPIDLDELILAVSNTEKRLSRLQQDISNNMQSAVLNIINKNKKISIPTNEGVHVLSSDDIIYLESDSNYTHVFLKDGRKLLISKTLKSMDEQLKDYHFCRVHSTYLVNLNEIERYIKGDGGHLILKNKTTIPVSRANKQDLLNKIGLS